MSIGRWRGGFGGRQGLPLSQEERALYCGPARKPYSLIAGSVVTAVVRAPQEYVEPLTSPLSNEAVEAMALASALAINATVATPENL